MCGIVSFMSETINWTFGGAKRASSGHQLYAHGHRVTLCLLNIMLFKKPSVLKTLITPELRHHVQKCMNVFVKSSLDGNSTGGTETFGTLTPQLSLFLGHLYFTTPG